MIYRALVGLLILWLFCCCGCASLLGLPDSDSIGEALEKFATGQADADRTFAELLDRDPVLAGSLSLDQAALDALRAGEDVLDADQVAQIVADQTGDIVSGAAFDTAMAGLRGAIEGAIAGGPGGAIAGAMAGAKNEAIDQAEEGIDYIALLITAAISILGTGAAAKYRNVLLNTTPPGAPDVPGKRRRV